VQKPVVLSPHALHMIAERAIEVEWIERVLAKPEMTAPDKSSADRCCAFGRIDEFGGRWLRVVYIETDETTRVITAFFDRAKEKRR
jgi:hypothetical protein